MRYVKKTVLFLILYIGIALLLSPLLEGILVEMVSDHYLLDHYTASQVAENTRQAQLDGTVIDEDIAIQDLSSILQNISDVDGDQVIGAVAIPAVGLYQPVFNGTTKASLIAGAGTMKSDQVMGQGNYCLAGHHMRDDSLLFGPLMEVKLGDWIQLTDKSRLYTYEVTEIETIHQNDVEVLEDTTSPAITLITCNQSGVATNYRLVVRGTLMDSSQYEDDEEENEYLEAFRYLTVKVRSSGIIKLWIWIIGSGILAALLLGVGTKILKTGGTRNKIRFLFYVVIVMGSWLCRPMSVSAEESPELQFSVKAVIPDNQVDQDNTYFDLKMEPSQKQTIEVEIWNLTDQELEVETQIHSAATNDNGVIEYGGNDIKPDDTLPCQIEEVVTCDRLVKVPANETTVIELTIHMPEEKYDGILAGGITFQLPEAKEIETEKQETSLSFRNTYSYVIGIVLREGEGEDKPELQLNEVTYNETGDSSVISANIQNIVSEYVNELAVEARITRKNTKGTLYQETKEDMRMAPNSNFNFTIDLGGNKLNEGEFTLYMTARTAENEWHWEKDFTVEAERFYSDEIRGNEEKTGYWWVLAVIPVISLVIGIIVYRYKRKHLRGGG